MPLAVLVQDTPFLLEQVVPVRMIRDNLYSISSQTQHTSFPHLPLALTRASEPRGGGSAELCRYATSRREPTHEVIRTASIAATSESRSTSRAVFTSMQC